MFVDKSEHWNENIHWASMGNYNKKLNCVSVAMKDWSAWMAKLPNIIPSPKNPLYVLFEDRKSNEPKYWLYEAVLSVLTVAMNESYLLCDFYIVSKKYDWLISICHEEIISYVGDCLNLNHI